MSRVPSSLSVSFTSMQAWASCAPHLTSVFLGIIESLSASLLKSPLLVFKEIKPEIGKSFKATSNVPLPHGASHVFCQHVVSEK